jgi:NAD(P)-dependent dehydrogenase (short-subunit alcohol dehydrogenase family)
VSNKAQVTAMFDQAEAELGPLWLLVNNAGVLNAAPTAEMPEELWDKAFAIDAKGVFLCSQAALRKMIPRRQGRIVNLASIAGLIVRTEQIAYCSAKAAVVHFSRCLAVEMAPHSITVNCLCPGMTGTDMLLDSAKARAHCPNPAETVSRSAGSGGRRVSPRGDGVRAGVRARTAPPGIMEPVMDPAVSRFSRLVPSNARFFSGF